MKKYEVVHYTENGRNILKEWTDSLKDKNGKIAIYRAIDRVKEGNLGKNHYCRDGVWEIVINSGPGYRIYYAIVGNVVVLLLCAGTKRTQQKDIDKAVKYLEDFKEKNNS